MAKSSKPLMAPTGEAAPMMAADLIPRRYHHGNLKQALLDAAEQILNTQGIQAVKLRAIARLAGVSHTAADPHFGDLTGLLSELAATGYERLYAAMTGSVGDLTNAPAVSAAAIARGYIGFAAANPSLFVLMFRGDALDMTRPRLQQAAKAAFSALSYATGPSTTPGSEGLSLAAGGRLAAAWSLVHGLAMLLISDGLGTIIHRIAPEPTLDTFIDAALSALSFEGD